MTAETAPTPPRGEHEDVDEYAEIAQEPHRITVLGMPCSLKRLRTREFLKLMRIVTEGMGGRLALMSLDVDKDDEAVMVGKLTGALVNALPYAEDAVIDFVGTMVEPDIDDPKQYRLIKQELVNPDLDTMTAVIQGVVEQEASELVRLGKAFGNWWKQARVMDRITSQVGSTGSR